MSKSMEQNGYQKETLSFQKASQRGSLESSAQRENAIRREWDQDGSQRTERTHQQQGQASSYGSTFSPMTHKWQGERNREQPFNNVGSYMTKKEQDVGSGKAHDQYSGSNTSVFGQNGSTASNR